PNLNGFDKSNQQEISAATKQFNLKEIISYFYKHVASNPKIPNSHVIAQMIPEYSKFSSFIHGGPYAFTQLNNHIEKQTTTHELERILEICLTAYITICKVHLMTYEPRQNIKRSLDVFNEINL